MRIKELIRKLELIEDNYGNIEVAIYDKDATFSEMEDLGIITTYKNEETGEVDYMAFVE